MLVTGFILVVIAIRNFEVVDDIFLRVAMAVLVMYRWNKCLYSLRAIKKFGLPMLPIIKAMWDIQTFCIVLAFYLAGLCHTYYTLGAYDIVETSTLIFRMAILGDSDLQEL